LDCGVNLLAEVYVVLNSFFAFGPILEVFVAVKRGDPQGQRQVNLSKLGARQPEFSRSNSWPRAPANHTNAWGSDAAGRTVPNDDDPRGPATQAVGRK
jgi:hypothetical protein